NNINSGCWKESLQRLDRGKFPSFWRRICLLQNKKSTVAIRRPCLPVRGGTRKEGLLRRHQVAEGPNGFRIELYADVPVDLAYRLMGSSPLAIWSVGGQRIEGIRDSNDAGPQRDLRAAKIPGVACAVPAFVMMQNHQARILKTVHIADGHPPELRM